MRKSTAGSPNGKLGSTRHPFDNGGEGGSFLHGFLGSPSALAETLRPTVLLAIALLLSALLVLLITAALAR